MAYIEKEINRKVGRAIHAYSLIEDGDIILAAVSGGADSLLMLHFLCAWQKKAPIDFDVLPVYLEMGYNRQGTWQVLREHFEKMKLPFYLEETQFGRRAHGHENRGKSPCFLCSWNRRKRLFELTQILGCNKIALGHNLDDLIETFFLNMLYSGEMSTMLPRQEMFKGVLTLVRPLALVEKYRIEKLSRILGLPVSTNNCPSASKSSRNHIRNILKGLYRQNSKARANIARALFNLRPEYLPGVLPRT